MSNFLQNSEVSIGEFVEELLKAFKRLRRKNVETLSILIDSIKSMNQEEMVRLDWELSILDAYIVLHLSSEMVKDQAKSKRVGQAFFERLEADVLNNPAWANYFREGTGSRYKSYFDDLVSSEAPSDRLESLYNEVADHIFGEQNRGSPKRWGLGVYSEAHSEYVKSHVSDVLRKRNLAGE